MILKGNQRAGGEDLASHLMNLYDNDAMELAEIKGTLAQDLHGALAEFEAHAAGTRCTQPLYSLSINPSQPMTREQYFIAIDRIGERLGLAGQPRAVVFHVKEGREHCHVAWSRIDTKNMRAIPLSHDHQKLRTLAQELARDFGHKLPDGLAANRGALRFAFTGPAKGPAELAQEERTGLAADRRRAEITNAWTRSDSAQSFVDALWERGYYLARGDRRGFVVVDRAGQVHSLPRQVAGAKAKDIEARLSPLAPDQLPDVKDTRKRIAADAEAQALGEDGAPGLRRSPEVLAGRQAQRRGKLAAERQALETAQQQERMALHAAHRRESLRPFARAASAVMALFAKVPVLRTVLGPLYRKPSLNMAERHRLENDALARRYARERKDIERREQALKRVEARENRSMARDQRRMEQHFTSARQRASDQIAQQIAENGADITQTSKGKPQLKPEQSKEFGGRGATACGVNNQRWEGGATTDDAGAPSVVSRGR